MVDLTHKAYHRPFRLGIAGFALLFLAIFSLIALPSCNGWDDDTDFEIGTKAGFFVCTDSSGGSQIVRVIGEDIEFEWNASVGVPGNAFGDIDFKENMFWLSDISARSIRQVDPTDGSIEATFDDLPLIPHIISVGDDQILVADTTTQEIAFVKIRNGETEVVRKGGIKARRCLYNAARFYLLHDVDSVTVYDENAMHPRGKIATGTYIDDILFDRYKNVRLISHDTSYTYYAIIGGNFEELAAPNQVITLQKIRYTPFFYSRFGTEFIQDIKLDESILQTTQAISVFPDSLDNFEVDFFEGRVYGTFRDSLIQYHIASDSITSVIPFPLTLQRAYFQYGNNQ